MRVYLPQESGGTKPGPIEGTYALDDTSVPAGTGATAVYVTRGGEEERRFSATTEPRSATVDSTTTPIGPAVCRIDFALARHRSAIRCSLLLGRLPPQRPSRVLPHQRLLVLHRFP
jgi:hypothetical protein